MCVARVVIVMGWVKNGWVSSLSLGFLVTSCHFSLLVSCCRNGNTAVERLERLQCVSFFVFLTESRVFVQYNTVCV